MPCHGHLILTARKADISRAISTGHIMCYRHCQHSRVDSNRAKVQTFDNSIAPPDGLPSFAS